MSKIICEICGTVYPDNATGCPICGYPRSIGNTPEDITEETVLATQSTERVRGGRFSNSNVKKRNQTAGEQQYPRTRRAAGKRQEEPEEPEELEDTQRGDNRGLVITAIILLVAIICVGTYIGVRFFRGADAYDRAAQTTGPVATQPSETVPEETNTACTDIQLGSIDLTDGVEFLGKGRAWRLNVSVVPENTTDELSITSSDESVATVSIADNKVEVLSVGPGTTTITVTCGSVSKQFPVHCNFDDPTEESTDPSESTEQTTEATEPTETTEAGTFSLNRTDITFSKSNETFTFSAGGVSNSQVTWSSGDESVVTIVNGKATAVGKGTTTITATYNGEKATCIIRCNLPAAQTAPTETTATTEATEATAETTESTEATEASEPT